ncbi:MAG: hypothetical protein H0X36_06135 [Sphingomonadaceae bacterium]|nr:hypothetical protein [Sphingomonadaceae bacterium]
MFASGIAGFAAIGLSPALFAQEAPSEGGRALFNQHCSACHTLENATNQHLPESKWRGIVTRMIDNGAEITPADQEVIVGYLAKNYGAPATPATPK